MKRPASWAAFVALSGAVAFGGFRFAAKDRTLSPSPVLDARPAALLPMAKAGAPVVSRIRGISSSGSRLSPEEAWSRFSQRLGTRLQATWNAHGKVVAIRGAPGEGELARNFDPTDSTKAIARAREILDAASELIGLDESLPLGGPVAKTGSVSAQVYFPETLGGATIQPFGSVSVDLGPNGELLNLSSDYLADLSVGNQKILSEAQAKDKAESVAGSGSAALAAMGGESIVWVSRSGPGGAPVASYAYSYNVGGREVVVDAGTGGILSRRDRRQF